MSVDNGSTNPFPNAVDKSLSEDADSVDSSDSKELVSFSGTREEKLSLAGGTIDNQSSYSLPNAVVDVKGDNWEVGVNAGGGEKELSEEQESVSSAESKELQILSAPRSEILQVVAGTVDNKSSVQFPNAVVDVPGDSWQVGANAGGGEHPLSEETSSVSDTDSKTLGSFTSSRRELLKLASGSVTNESSYQFPNAVLDKPGDNWERGVNAGGGEVIMGAGATGKALDENGQTISGTLALMAGGQVILSTSVSGMFVASFPPFPGAVLGESDEGEKVPELDAAFVPNQDGVRLITSDIKYPRGEEISASYGKVEGKILDANGNPVAGEPVSGDGVSTASDSRGDWGILAPGGQNINLTSLGGTTSEAVVGEEQETKTLKFQYAGINVTVRLPGGKPAKDVPVSLSITGEAKTTDDTGKASFSEVPPSNSGEVRIMDGIIEPASSLSGGSFSDIRASVGAGITGKFINENTGKLISSVDVTVITDDGEFKGSNPTSGRYYAGVPESGKAIVVASDKDRRFSKRSLVVSLEDDESRVLNIELTPRNNTSKY